ncbi:MAG: metallophosphatase family protein [Omnitrophica bacterium]|nr:metallophosphatase family protein [Candidatus Omnitrophota bacterium]
MRYGIISDIHGNLEALEAVIHALSRERIDKYLCAGDIVGYGADSGECIKKTRALNPIVICGNHDAASSGLIDTSNFTEPAKNAVKWTKKHLNANDASFLRGLDFVFKNKHLALVHGTLEEPEEFNYIFDSEMAQKTFDLMDSPVCFVGHSHCPLIFSYKNNAVKISNDMKADLSSAEKLIVNVGSVGQPRDGDPRLCYSIYDTDRGSVRLKRLSYDVSKAQRKIVDAGLPAAFAYRLGVGR